MLVFFTGYLFTGLVIIFNDIILNSFVQYDCTKTQWWHILFVFFYLSIYSLFYFVCFFLVCWLVWHTPIRYQIENGAITLSDKITWAVCSVYNILLLLTHFLGHDRKIAAILFSFWFQWCKEKETKRTNHAI